LLDKLLDRIKEIRDRIAALGGTINANVALDTVCAPYMTGHIQLNSPDNDPAEVRKLETFLNEKQGENLIVDGVYGQADFEAVKRFQAKYSHEVLDIWGLNAPTGYVYITTLNKINSFYCNQALQCPGFVEHASLEEPVTSAETHNTKVLLTELGFYNGAINQSFDQPLHDALVNFQDTFAVTILDPWGLKQGTGYKYKTTNKFLNYLAGCPTETLYLENGAVVDY